MKNYHGQTRGTEQDSINLKFDYFDQMEYNEAKLFLCLDSKHKYMPRPLVICNLDGWSSNK